MIATIFAIALCGVLIFLLGRLIGKLEQESETRQHIKNTGLFMLKDGFYQATKVNIDTSKPRQIIDPETLLHDHTPAFRQPEKTPRPANQISEIVLHNTAPAFFRQPEKIEEPEEFESVESFESDLTPPPAPPKKRINRRKTLTSQAAH